MTLRIATFQMRDGVEKWLVHDDAYDEIMRQFALTDEDTDDPQFHHHTSPIDRAANAAGRCLVLCSSWGTQDLPADLDELDDLLRQTCEGDRDEVRELCEAAMD